MPDRIELTPSQRTRCNRLIRRLCVNYDNGNCLPLDEGDGCVCVQMISISLICKYFRNAVLPAEKELYVEIFRQRTYHCAECGASKIGKSWLMLWLGLQVAQGLPVWGLTTQQCDVLYLSLEDTQRRIKDRLYNLTDTAPSNLYFAVMCGLIGGGLEEQITDFLSDHPKTKLVIIDTLQKVRDTKGGAGKTGMYGNDYDDISSIKKIADEYNIAVLLVHHLRKLKDSDDPFNEVSGSTGIIGAADTNYVFKRKRSTNAATLLVSGRDMEYQELTLQFNNLVWELVERKNSEDIHKAELPRFLFRVVDFMENRAEWVGTATELLAEMKETETTPNVVTKYLGQFSCEVLEPVGIEYRTKRTGKSRLIKLIRNDGGDENDNDFTI